MSDVMTTITEYGPILGLIAFILSVFSVFLASGWGTRGIIRTFAFSRTRKLKGLEKWRTRLEALHDPNSARAYYGHLLSGILWVLAVLAAAMTMDAQLGSLLNRPRPLSPELQVGLNALRPALQYGSGLGACLIALSRLRDYREVQRYDQTLAVIKRRIAKLKDKQAVHQPAAAV